MNGVVYVRHIGATLELGEDSTWTVMKLLRAMRSGRHTGCYIVHGDKRIGTLYLERGHWPLKPPRKSASRAARAPAKRAAKPSRKRR